ARTATHAVVLGFGGINWNTAPRGLWLVAARAHDEPEIFTLRPTHDRPSSLALASITTRTGQLGWWQFARCTSIAARRSLAETSAHIDRTVASKSSAEDV